MEGVSRNGSLGALGLFARGESSAAKFLRAGIGGFERRGWDCDLAWAAGEEGKGRMGELRVDVDLRTEGLSSNPRT